MPVALQPRCSELRRASSFATQGRKQLVTSIVTSDDLLLLAICASVFAAGCSGLCAGMAFKLTILALVAVGFAVASAADSTSSAQVSSSTPTWTQLQQSKRPTSVPRVRQSCSCPRHLLSKCCTSSTLAICSHLKANCCLQIGWDSAC